jgi:acyl-CoA thioesterase-1
MHNIICFGDSITLGELDEIGGGWVDRLKSEYMRRWAIGSAAEALVFNLGIGGETTQGLRGRFEAELKQRRSVSSCDIATLAYGANDAVVRGKKHLVALDVYIENLACCIKIAHAQTVRVALVNITPIAPAVDGRENSSGSIRTTATISAYNAGLSALARKTGAHLIDVNQALRQHVDVSLRPDGVHPNHLGHQLTYETVLRDLDTA